MATVTAMETKDRTPVTRLGLAMKELGIGDSVLANRAGEHRQSIFKLRRGETKMSKLWAMKLEKHLPGFSAAYLMGFDGTEFGEDGLSRPPEGVEQPERAGEGDPDGMVVLELDVRARGGHGGEMPDLDAEGHHPVLARWSMPRNYLKANAADPACVRIVRVSGDSMEPDYPANDRILVDTSHRVPSPEGVYVLWDGYGLILKRLSLVYGSNPPRVTISSSNPAYPPIERLVDEVTINGRVVGKWTWK